MMERAPPERYGSCEVQNIQHVENKASTKVGEQGKRSVSVFGK